MAYITVEQLEEFSRKYPDDGATLQATYCDSAMEAVAKYLGYDPELQDYTTSMYGRNSDTLPLKAMPVKSIISVTDSNGNVYDITDFVVNKNCITFKGGKTFSASVEYTFMYTAGYETVPAQIQLCALQVASVFWESAEGNLAVSSTSFPEAGTRVFNNFKIDRYLEQIETYRKYSE